MTSLLFLTPPVNFTYDVGLVYSDKECKVKAGGQNWVGEYRLTKPVGVCTSNVSWSQCVVCTMSMMGNGDVPTRFCCKGLLSGLAFVLELIV